MWRVIQSPDFSKWFNNLSTNIQEKIYENMLVLKEFGPSLSRPYVDTIKASHYKNMKELRVQVKGDPYRILFLFSPERKAILLIGANKKGKKRFYEEIIPKAEKIYKKYLEDKKR